METKKKRILLMEGSAGYTRLFRQTFEKYAEGEFNLICEKDFTGALKRLSEEKIDLVLLDLFDLENSGQEALAKFQETDSPVPILALTGSSKGSMTLQLPRWAPVVLSPKNMFLGAPIVSALRYYTGQNEDIPAIHH